MIKYILYLAFYPQLIVFGTIDRIQKALEKKEYEKAHELILKGYEKEPDNPGISYYQAILFFDREFAQYNIDTARLSINRSIQAFEKASNELKTDLQEDGITLSSIKMLQEKVRDRSFQNTLKDLSIANINRYQVNYPNSIYADILTFKKDSIEYDYAIKNQSERGLKEFIQSHPTSIFRPKADSLLDLMRWERLKENGNLKDYYAFLESYPFTRHRQKAERYILNVSTASHKADKYASFIKMSSEPALKKQAGDVLFFIDQKLAEAVHPLKDSLTKASAHLRSQLLPVVQEGKIGFYDETGVIIIAPTFTSIPDRYKCTSTSDPWLLGFIDQQGHIVTKSRLSLLAEVDDYQSIAKDIALIYQGKQGFLFHKSGYQILLAPIEQAEVISNKWIKIRQNGRWGLISYLGLPITQSIYDDIYRIGDFWVFERDGLLAVYTEDLILEEIEERGLSLEFKFDDIELVNNNALIGFRGDRECLLDSTLKFLIPWGEHEIYPEDSGWYLKSKQGYQLYNPVEEDLINKYYPYLESNDGWLALKTSEDWMLLPRKEGLLPSRAYDSIKLLTPHCVALMKDDEKYLLFESGKRVSFDSEKVSIPPNHTHYVNVSDTRITTIYNAAGDEVLSGKFERTTFINDTLIRVEMRGKQGLIHTSGKWILNPVFDTIDEKNGLVLTLIKGKIGCYDPVINELIETGYEERLVRIGQHYLAKKGGKFGLIDFASQPILSFNYDEIQLWNDTTYLVKDGAHFWIIDENEEPVYESMESVQKLISTEEGTSYRYVKNGKYGLISNRFGVLLTPEFTDIFNIGTNENPLFFSDQHLDKAGFHVVSYVNQKGELVLSKAYTKEEFEQILCDE